MQVWDTKFLSVTEGTYADTMLASLYKDVMAKGGVDIKCPEGFDKYTHQARGSMLHDAYCALFVAWCALFVAWCALFVAWCALFVVCWSLNVICCCCPSLGLPISATPTRDSKSPVHAFTYK
jgi:hypothetical protein